MIKHLENHEINKIKWDETIRHAPNGNIYAYSWYLDIVATGWEALVNEDYSAVFPLTAKKKININYLCQPPFSQQLGLFSKNQIPPDMLAEFLSHIPVKFKLIEINLNASNNTTPNNFTAKENSNYELNLNSPYIEICKNYSDNTTRNIRKAEKSGLNIGFSVNPDEIIELFKKNKGRQLKVFNSDSYRILKALMFQSVYKNIGQIIGAYDTHNQLCGAVFFAEANKKHIFLFSALNDNGRKNAAMPYIIDTFIKSKAGTDAVLDFEGSNDENLARFYKSFGAKKNTYLHIYLNKLPYFVKAFFNVYKLIK
ncbi:MAG: hypothetical protein PHT69_08170 [Bacteroidales bacterium]|nr:hypothetical protein [Bacteroidales bacterium]